MPAQGPRPRAASRSDVRLIRHLDRHQFRAVSVRALQLSDLQLRPCQRLGGGAHKIADRAVLYSIPPAPSRGLRHYAHAQFLGACLSPHQQVAAGRHFRKLDVRASSAHNHVVHPKPPGPLENRFQGLSCPSVNAPCAHSEIVAPVNGLSHVKPGAGQVELLGVSADLGLNPVVSLAEIGHFDGKGNPVGLRGPVERHDRRLPERLPRGVPNRGPGRVSSVRRSYQAQSGLESGPGSGHRNRGHQHFGSLRGYWREEAVASGDFARVLVTHHEFVVVPAAWWFDGERPGETAWQVGGVHVRFLRAHGAAVPGCRKVHVEAGGRF